MTHTLADCKPPAPASCTSAFDVFGNAEYLSEVVGTARKSTREADDEFDYAFEGRARNAVTHKQEFKPNATPAHLLTNVRSQPLAPVGETFESDEGTEEDGDRRTMEQPPLSRPSSSAACGLQHHSTLKVLHVQADAVDATNLLKTLANGQEPLHALPRVCQPTGATAVMSAPSATILSMGLGTAGQRQDQSADATLCSGQQPLGYDAAGDVGVVVTSTVVVAPDMSLQGEIVVDTVSEGMFADLPYPRNSPLEQPWHANTTDLSNTTLLANNSSMSVCQSVTCTSLPVLDPCTSCTGLCTGHGIDGDGSETEDIMLVKSALQRHSAPAELAAAAAATMQGIYRAPTAPDLEHIHPTRRTSIASHVQMSLIEHESVITGGQGESAPNSVTATVMMRGGSVLSSSRSGTPVHPSSEVTQSHSVAWWLQTAVGEERPPITNREGSTTGNLAGYLPAVDGLAVDGETVSGSSPAPSTLHQLATRTAAPTEASDGSMTAAPHNVSGVRAEKNNNAVPLRSVRNIWLPVTASAGSESLSEEKGYQPLRSPLTTNLVVTASTDADWDRANALVAAAAAAAHASTATETETSACTPCLQRRTYGQLLCDVQQLSFSAEQLRAARQLMREPGAGRQFFFTRLFCFRPQMLSVSSQDQIAQVLCCARTPYTDTQSLHWDLLKSSYLAFTGDEREPSRYGKHWMIMGWQGDDPSTDLRGCGIFGLLQLVSLYDSNPAVARRYFQLSRHEVQEFPLATVSLNLTKFTLQALREGRLDSAIDNAGNVWAVLAQFHSGAMSEFDRLWRQGHKTMTESGFVMRQIETLCLKQPWAVLHAEQS